jgi:hypothetical protein
VAADEPLIAVERDDLSARFEQREGLPQRRVGVW